jgi:hypothetical protein
VVPWGHLRSTGLKARAPLAPIPFIKECRGFWEPDPTFSRLPETFPGPSPSFSGVPGSVFESVCNVSSAARDVSGPSGKVDGPSRNSGDASKNSGGRPGKENTRRILLFSSSAGSGMRHFSRILPLVPAGLREKARILPPATPAMRHTGRYSRHISRNTPLAGRKMPLNGPGLRHNHLKLPLAGSGLRRNYLKLPQMA